MFAVNDTVQYGVNGICKITDIRSCRFQEEPEDYYLLKPLHDEKSTIYVPVQNPELVSKMRRVLSKEAIYDLIRAIPEQEVEWIADDHERQRVFREMMHSGDDLQLFRLIKTLHLRKKEQEQHGRKLRAMDERLMQDAERILYDESAVVLDMPSDQVLPFILEQMDVAAESNQS